jgi:hypothetical protein
LRAPGFVPPLVGGEWTVRLGGSFAKALPLGERPIKLELYAYYNAIRPKASYGTWLLQVTLAFQFPD